MARKRKLKELTDADIAACEPESIWLETRKCPLPAHCVLWVIILLLVSGVLWACLAKVDKVVAAEGKLVTTRPNITMKPLERSVIKRVLVQVGQVVEKDQVLIELDTTMNAAELGNLREQMTYYKCLASRLNAERMGASSIDFPKEVAQSATARRQNALFSTRRDFYAKRVAYLQASVNRYGSTTESILRSLAKYDEMMVPVNRIEQMYENLAEKGMTPLVDVFNTRIQRMGNEIEVENQRTRLVEDQQLCITAKSELAAFQAEWMQDIDKELADAELQISILQEKIRQSEYLVSVDCLKAPCRAVVHEVAPYQEGSAVREAESYISLIPLDVPLEAEIDILPKDVGLLRVGDSVRLKLDAFPFQRYGTLSGTLRFISADTHESSSNMEDDSEKSMTAPGGRRPQFRARLTVSGELADVPSQLWQSAGMRLRAEIKVGERRVISYLVHPFIKAMDESIREP